MNCIGVCSDFAVKEPKSKQIGRYESGQKRCTFCDIFMVCDGNRCPCCNCILRKKPRNADSRNKLVEKINNKKS